MPAARRSMRWTARARSGTKTITTWTRPGRQASARTSSAIATWAGAGPGASDRAEGALVRGGHVVRVHQGHRSAGTLAGAGGGQARSAGWAGTDHVRVAGDRPAHGTEATRAARPWLLVHQSGFRAADGPEPAVPAGHGADALGLPALGRRGRRARCCGRTPGRRRLRLATRADHVAHRSVRGRSGLG